MSLIPIPWSVILKINELFSSFKYTYAYTSLLLECTMALVIKLCAHYWRRSGSPISLSGRSVLLSS